jgi:flagellar hook-basal body complex protein FliE
MKIFNNDAFISAAAAKNYAAEMVRTHQRHMLPPDSPYSGSGKNILHLRDTIGANGVTGAGSFEDAMLQALDKVSGVQHFASDLSREAIINPASVDIHDISMAQAQANLSFDITRNILSRLVQGWRDLINTR